MKALMKPARLFVWSALVLSAFGLVISTGLSIAITVGELDTAGSSRVGFDNSSGASVFVQEHLAAVSGAMWVAMAIGVISSIGLLRRNKWAYATLRVLLVAWILWGIIGLFLEAKAIAIDSGTESVMGTFMHVATVLGSLAGLGLIAILLWKLSSREWRRELLG